MAQVGKLGNISLVAKAYLVLSGLGIAVSIYHAYDELTGSFTSCSVSSNISCEGVFESGHTSLFGVPFYVLGLVWFPLALFLGVATLQRFSSKRELNGSILLPFLLIGCIFTIYLWYLELGVIGVICPVCVSLYIINYVMTAIAVRSLF